MVGTENFETLSDCEEKQPVYFKVNYGLFLFAHNIFDNPNFNLDDQEVVGE